MAGSHEPVKCYGVNKCKGTGAQGHGIAKDLVFGSKLELIQSELPNPMVVVGPGAVS